MIMPAGSGERAVTVYGAVPFVGVRVCVNWAPCVSVSADAPKFRIVAVGPATLNVQFCVSEFPSLSVTRMGVTNPPVFSGVPLTTPFVAPRPSPGGSMDRFVQFV